MLKIVCFRQNTLTRSEDVAPVIGLIIGITVMIHLHTTCSDFRIALDCNITIATVGVF